MILMMANGASQAVIEKKAHQRSFQELLNHIMEHLAKAVVKDGEGATKFVTIRAKGAVSDAAADKIADTIANSNLVKTAIFGEDANWGRILAAAGRAGVPISPEKIDLYFDNLCLVKSGSCCGIEAEDKADQILKRPEFGITINLNEGNGESFRYTCDLSIDYVRINANYRT
jgi:glutamate N-acetyltransferase/amino-acid N-acetyltransferase